MFMSLPEKPDNAKLISSIFSPDKELINRGIQDMEAAFGHVERVSQQLFFDRTRYYAREMGWPLFRRFVSFEKLISPEDIVRSKLKTNEIEQQYLDSGNRLVNIDPGLLSAERLILATGKNYIHRVYLSQGIYADVTLVYKRGSFRSLDWTYPDYASEEVVLFFNEIRNNYMKYLRTR
jgi:hypothetical protein